MPFSSLPPRHAVKTFAARVLPSIQELAPRLREGHLGDCQLEGAYKKDLLFSFFLSAFSFPVWFKTALWDF